MTSLDGKSGIRSATLFLFTCFRSTLLILLSFVLFLCRYHAGVANNRFIGCLVGLLLLLFIVSFASRLPTRSNPTIDEKKNSETRYVSPNFLASPLKIDTFSILKDRFELMYSAKFRTT